MSAIDTSERWASLRGGLGCLLDDAVGAFLLIEPGGRIVECNAAARAMLGWAREEAVGTAAVELLIAADARPEFVGVFERLLASRGEPSSGMRLELRAVQRSGREIPIEAVFSLLRDDERSLVAVFIYDISERKEARAREARLEALIASSGEAIISCSLDSMIESWNPAAERLFGYSATVMIGKSLKQLLPSASFAGLGGRLRALASGESVSLELSTRHRNGDLIETDVTTSPLRGEAGEVVGVASIVRDVTARNHDAASLALATSRFSGAFEAASIGMAVLALNGRFIEVNPALCRLLGRDPSGLLTTPLQALTHPEDLGPIQEHLQRALSGSTETFQESQRYLLPDGGIVWVLLTITIARNAGGAPLHFVAQMQDITARKTAEGELRRYAAQLESLSAHDALTSLSNRPAFESALEAELQALQADGPDCSVVLASVQGGDAAAIAVAESLQRVSRDTDLVAHLGAGELTVLLPGTGVEAAAGIAQRALDALDPDLDPRVSYATATPGDSVAHLMGRAREGLVGLRLASTVSPSAPLPTGIGRLLDLARRQLGMPVSFLTQIGTDQYTFVRFAGDYERFGVAEGDSMMLADTHCERMLDGRIGSIVQDLNAERETRDLDVTKGLGLRAYAGVPVRLRSGEIYGTLCTVDTETHPELRQTHADLLAFLSKLAAELIEDEAEQRATRRAEEGDTGVRTLLTALEARDFYTGEHSNQVVALASAVARTLGLDEGVTRDVEQVARLHDIGKVGIPDAILQKQGPLDDEEWLLMRQHPIIGERIIAGTPSLSHLASAVRAEHERWDGTGYPDGLAGHEIPLPSRITLACDALHAMTSDRPYRPAMTVQRARDELAAGAGTQFDARVISALLAEIQARA